MGARLILFGIIVVFAAVSWVFSFEADRLQSLTQRVGVIDHRRFETLTIITAGTGAAQEDPERLGPAIAVGAGERLVLVDAGRAAAEALRSAQLPLDQVDTVFLTSLLPENVVGLPELLLTGWAAQRERPLRLVGPPGTRALAEGLERAYALPIETTAEGLGMAADGARLEAIEAGDGWSEERDGLAVRAAQLDGGPLPALAYRFESGRRAAVVNGVGWGGDSAGEARGRRGRAAAGGHAHADHRERVRRGRSRGRAHRARGGVAYARRRRRGAGAPSRGSKAGAGSPAAAAASRQAVSRPRARALQGAGPRGRGRRRDHTLMPGSSSIGG